MNLKSIVVLLTAVAAPAVAGPLGYAICQTGCNSLAVACYGAAGFTMGVALPAVPAVLVSCNVGLGTCMAACAVVALSPTL
ncbi:uncharacterized protein EDB91DRAFT_1061537 [Suillus paluster]|uniref:uncharacterized protein n=1 Tax=Suillus paluster TaxID=48578 RepID=UPI001B875192|nr:uncharacterized protein EDB91DRAFT_1061537 [Suillus paluster]KAG1726616.1 hypothetical protein EDB91DRAFT_1061537 [Suillus paluster]